MFLDGLAFKMEHGFQRTEMGRQAYAMNLAIITQAVLRTVYARIMQVLVGNRNWLSVLAAKNFPSAAVQAREISKASVNSFGCIQKNTHGLDLLMNNILRLFHDRMLSAPDAVVIPHGVMAYLSTCKPESKIYALCGALAERLGIKSERELITNVYGDSYSVFEHRPMNVANDTANEVNMLARDREVGNYWKIFRNSYGSPFSTPSAPDGQPSAIRIIDHDRQRWVTITLAEALSHSEAFDVNGNINEDGPLARFLMGPGVAKGTSGYQSMPTYAAVGGPAEDGFKRSETNRYLTERPSGEILFAMLGKQNLLPKTVSMAIRSMHAAARRLGDIRDDSGSNTLPNGFKKRIRAAINALEETSPTAPASMTATSTTAPGFDEAALKANLISSFKSVSGTTLSTDDKIVIAPELEIISRGLAGRNQPCYLFVSDRLGASQRFYTGEVNSGGTITTLNPATREETTKKIEAAFATGNFNEVVISGTVGAVATKSSVASAVSANIGSFVDDIAKGDKEKAESISLALADVMQKTNKFSKTIKKLQASNNIDDTDTSALKAASDAASQEFLKEAKKAWKDITSIAAEQGSLFGGGYDEITVGDTSDQGSASKGDAYRIWAGTDAPIGADMAGTSNRGGHYGRGGERFNGTAGDDLDFYLSLPLTLQAIEVLDSFGIVTPFGAIVFRPFQSFNMGSAVIMKSGNDTGFTCVGNSDFQLGDSVTNKTHLGHFTFYFEPVVHVSPMFAPPTPTSLTDRTKKGTEPHHDRARCRLYGLQRRRRRALVQQLERSRHQCSHQRRRSPQPSLCHRFCA